MRMKQTETKQPQHYACTEQTISSSLYNGEWESISRRIFPLSMFSQYVSGSFARTLLREKP